MAFKDPQRQREYKRAYYQANKEQIKEKVRVWCEENQGRRSEYQRQYREENGDRIREAGRAYAEANREKRREYARRYREEHRDRLREEEAVRRDANRESYNASARQRRDTALYGIAEDGRQRMWEYQEGICPICDLPLPDDPDDRRSSHIDHCHNTGHVRGLIHARCNLLLGAYEELLSTCPGGLMQLETYARASRPIEELGAHA